MDQNELFEKIARDILNIETLDTRNSDSLDFKDLPVWAIKEALEKAYAAGRNSVLKSKE